MKKYLLLTLTLLCFSLSTRAAVILQYHHVSTDTPASTSISPLQFEAHMQYLADNGYQVVTLSEIMNSIKKQQPIVDKTIAITFDDAYLDILLQAKPILDRFGYPFTIFVNPGIVNQGRANYLSWQQLKAMADTGVIIANHGFHHDSLARTPSDTTEQEWLNKQGKLLLKAEQIIEEKTGQSWRYLAYPYGEYTPAIEQLVSEHDFIAFSQQSGAVGLATILTRVPRFPVSQPYDKITSLKDKFASLPLVIENAEHNAETVYQYDSLKSVSFNIIIDDFHPTQLNCYVTQGKIMRFH